MDTHWYLTIKEKMVMQKGEARGNGRTPFQRQMLNFKTLKRELKELLKKT